MTDDPELIERDALCGANIAISVSDSSDLARLGLLPEHCRIVVAEITRAVLLAGGGITYGGRLRPAGFTQVMMDEVRRFGDARRALTICVPWSEHIGIEVDDLRKTDERLGTSAKLVPLSSDGVPISIRDIQKARDKAASSNAAAELSAMRRYVTDHTSARIIVGGKLRDFHGRLPGVIEEASLSIKAGHPLYVAGGYGGAASAVARALGYDTFEWAPSDFPKGANDELVVEALRDLAAVAGAGMPEDGLSEEERLQLAATPRAGDIATLIVRGAARARVLGKR